MTSIIVPIADKGKHSLLGLAFILNSILATSCAQQLDDAEYRSYLRDPAHGLNQQTTIKGAIVSCSYRPTELSIAQDLRNGEMLSTTMRIDSLRRSYAGKAYFTLALSKDGAEIENQLVTNQTAYAEAISYLNSELSQDVYLVRSPQDSSAALASIYPRQYGATGRSTVLLVFDIRQRPLNQDFHLTFHDRHFGLGTLYFPFRAADIAAVPALRF